MGNDQEKKKDKIEGSQALGQVADEEDEDADPNEEEEQLRRNYEEVLGSVMKVARQEFMPCLQACGQRIQQWLQIKENKVLALYFACDLLEHLKEDSQSLWSIFMPSVMSSLTDEQADQRTAAAYAVNLAAMIPAFSQA